MQTVVVGAGEVGFDVARILAVEQHDVTVVDVDDDVLQKVQDKLDVLTVHGNGTSAATLEEAGIPRPSCPSAWAKKSSIERPSTMSSHL